MSLPPCHPHGDRPLVTIQLRRRSPAFAARFFSFGLLVLGIGSLLLVPVKDAGRRHHRPAPGDAAGSGEESPSRLTLAPLGSSPWKERQLELARLGADRWQAAGYRGQGIKVAVLDTGFRGYRKYLGFVLPPRVTARSFRSDGNLEARDSQHGVLCGEVIHAIAPDAQLLFANWELDRPDEFLQAVRWARAEGARVISCSVVTPCWSDGDGDGEIHHALAQLLGPGTAPGDALCFASAGNTTERHWCGPLHTGPEGFHEWRPGQIDNLVTPWSKERVSIELYGHLGADYELSVRDVDMEQSLGHARTNSHDAWTSAVVHFVPVAGHSYAVRVRLARGVAGSFHLTSMESSLGYTTARASVCFPADGPEVVAMGAVDATRHRVWYSACGPNSTCPKPDFVATIPFPSLWRSRPFAGTSAAAPQGAGLAALCWSRHPDWTAEHVRAALRASAEDLYTPGPDFETGYGLIHLPRD